MNIRSPSSILLVSLVLTGCGGIKYGDVTGRVTYKGSPLPAGKVVFWPQASGGAPASAPIEEDGSYAVSVPVGEASVTVETESFSPKAQNSYFGAPVAKNTRAFHGSPPPEVAAMIKADRERSQASEPPPQPQAKYVKIDMKYSRPTTSGLQTTVQSGTQEYNIDLK
jgi:hypothetical protein